MTWKELRKHAAMRVFGLLIGWLPIIFEHRYPITKLPSLEPSRDDESIPRTVHPSPYRSDDMSLTNPIDFKLANQYLFVITICETRYEQQSAMQ